MKGRRFTLLAFSLCVLVVASLLPISREVAQWWDFERTRLDAKIDPETQAFGELDPKPEVVVYNIDSDFIALKVKMGEPLWSGPSIYGFTWYAYHRFYTNYQLIGVRDNKVVAYYAHMPVDNADLKLDMTENRLKVEKSLGPTLKKLEKRRATYYYDAPQVGLYKKGNHLIRVFYDGLDNDRVVGVYVVNLQEELDLKGYFGEPTPELLSAFNHQVEDLINVERIAKGMNALTPQAEMEALATGHARDMAANGFFSHVGSDQATLRTRAERLGISFVKLGENIAQGQSDGVFAHHELMNSEGHRANLLDADYIYMGVGVAVDAFKTPSFVQNFLKN